MLVLLIRSSFGQAQTPTDTICIEVPKFKKIYTAAIQKRYVDSLLVISEKQVGELKYNISLLQEKDAELKKMYDAQLDILHNQIVIYKEQITGYERLVKLERRKRRLITFGGVLTTGAAIFLSLKK